ncbi:dihydroorotase [Candidatus Parcubacteria bacterium]|nr:dihydroorotase [Candidatus Parcubacteria bacterium]
MEVISIRRPDDFHVHFRQGQVMRTVIPYTASCFGRAMVMPNPPKPILTAEDANEYYWQIKQVAQANNMSDFEPLMTIQITDDTTPKMIHDASKIKPIIAGKVYPKGVTTNSHNGVTDFRKLFPVFDEMSKCGMGLSIHGQKPGSFCLDRENDFHSTLLAIVDALPKLRIALEHMSTKQSVELVEKLPANVVGTITAHHLVLTLDDVLAHKADNREGLNPHHYCQPIMQRPVDRDALIRAATSGNPKFFFGSDTAPHLRETKESSCGCAGVFSAPVVFSVLASVFESQGKLDKLQPFTSTFGAEHYRLEKNIERIELRKAPFEVPLECDGIVPFMAGKTLDWEVLA